MKRLGAVLATVVFLACASAGDLKNTAERIEAWGSDPVIVQAVVAQNARKVAASEVGAIDQAWIAGGEARRAEELLNNAAAARLRELAAAAGVRLSEAFVMDDQGALVATTHKTSDYWQGDEAKWQKSFDGGAGAVFIDEPQFDASANEDLVQISVPVRDGGRAIGAITVGVRTASR